MLKFPKAKYGLFFDFQELWSENYFVRYAKRRNSNIHTSAALVFPVIVTDVAG